MKKIIPFLFLILSIAVNAQEKDYELYDEYDWEKDPKKIAISEEDRVKNETMLFDKRSIQFLNTETGAAAFFLKHQITLLNSDKSIEEYNKFYIAKSDDEEIITIKARVIKPSGEIISVSKADIKDALDEDGKVKYNYFAFEGLEKGSLIEFLQYTKGSPDFSGVKIPVQGEVNKNM